MAKDEVEGEPRIHDVYSFDTYTILTLFLGIIAEKAWQNLGLRVKPGTDKMEVDLDKANTAIDVASMLFEKLKPHLPQSEKEQMEGVINDLKLNFVRISKK